MCSHYQSLKEQNRYLRHFGVVPAPEPGRYDVWPGYVGTFIRAHPHADAQDHALMNQFHKPTDEKRMVVILPPERYQDWLISQSDISNFLVPYPADCLQATAPEPAQGSLLT